MRKIFIVCTILILLSSFGCRQNPIFQQQTVTPTTLRDVPAQRLNYRFEPDVPAPTEEANPQTQERNAAVQADFDQNRPLQILYKTLASPDKQRVLVIYNKVEDSPTEYRLDMYSTDGKFLRKITPNGMAVQFPDTIVWSPDSTDLAFVAKLRTVNPNATSETAPNSSNATPAANTETNSPITSPANSNLNASANTQPDVNAQTVATPNAPEPPPVLTFRTEQIYLCNSDGDALKPLTQNEGLIYFYYVWSPDSSSLAALAAKYNEWTYLQFSAEQKSEIFIPLGRLRLIEKSGRERRLDDAPTQVHPVWSPDSAKVAIAFDRQVRIYDAIGETPTQAGIVLRNELLRSSQIYDQQQQLQQESENTNSNTNSNAKGNTNAAIPNPISTPVDNSISTLPDENTLVSFNPIIMLDWEQDNLLYFQTGYVKEFKNGEGSRSYLRWHRLALSPQAVALGNSNK